MIAVLKKAFTVLEVFADQGDPLSLARVTEAARLPKPTVYRLMQSLVDMGYLLQDRETGEYLRTPALEHLAHNSHHEFLRLKARPALERLHRQFEETVHLGILCGQKIEYLMTLETPRGLRCVPQRRHGEPYYVSAMGRAIAAYLTPEERRQLLERTQLKPLTPKSVATKRDLQRIFEETHRQGWACDEEETHEGVVGMAAPLMQRERPIAAVGISVPTARLSDEKREAMLEALRKLPGWGR